MANTYLSIKTYPVKFNVPLAFCQRSHRIIQLSNGILTLLISDASKDLASVALCVASGSHNDPDNIPGLAHLCEHMLFLGTKEFPNPTSYNETIMARGGRSNAFTAGDQSCFYFDFPTSESQKDSDSTAVNEPTFNHVLENFSSFFKSPKFDEAYIRNEVLSVDDEHISNRMSPEKIFFHGLKILANHNHPFSRFATGNIYTIQNRPKTLGLNLHSELLKYYHENYISSKMTLVISGPQSLNHLQKLSIMRFADIPLSFDKKKERHNTGVELKNNLSDFSILSDSYSQKYQEPIFKQENMNKCLFLKSGLDSRIRLIFPTRYIENDDESMLFQKTWANMLGDESIGSLCSYLIGVKNFASSVSVFVQNLAFKDHVLILDIKLTTKGEKNIKSILIAIFQYIEQVILNCSDEQMARCLSEMTTIEKLNYIHMDSKNSSIDDVSNLTEKLQQDLGKINSENILQGSNYWSDHYLSNSGDFKENPSWWYGKAAKFKSATKKVLTLTNFNLLVMNDNSSVIRFLNNDNPISESGLSEDFYYQFEYAIYYIDPIHIYENALQYCPSFLFPKSNPYLSHNQADLNRTLENISLNSTCNPLGFPSKKTSLKEPELIDFSHFHETWFKLETKEEFASAKATSSCRIQGLNLRPSPLVTVGFEILCELIGNSLRHKLYPGELVGYSWGLFPGTYSSASLTFTASGLKDKFHSFLESIIEEIYSTFLDVGGTPYHVFMKARVAVRRSYQDLINSRGIKKAIAGTLVFLEKSIWSIEQRFEALEEIDIEFLSKMCAIFLQRLKYTSIFLQGNLNINEAFEISKVYNRFITSKVSEIARNRNFIMLEPLSYLLRAGTNYIYEENASNNDPLNTIFYYIQLGNRDDIFIRTLAKFISYLLSIPVVSDLRTKQQLGYSVHSGLMLFRTTLGVYVTISSAMYNPMYLHRKIEEFLFEWELLLHSYTTEDFATKAIFPFIQSYLQQNRINEGELPSNLMFDIEPMKSSSIYPCDNIYDIHKHCWNSIISRTYRFGGIIGDEEIDVEIIKELTKEKLIHFVKDKISIKSNTKSSLSLMFTSQLSRNDVERESIKVQLQEHLTLNGLSIQEDEIESLLIKCNNDSRLINKELFKWFKDRNEGTKFFMIQVKDFCKTKSMSLRSFNIKHLTPRGYPVNINFNKVIKELGDEYKTNLPVLLPTKIANWKELHKDSSLTKSSLTQSLFHKLSFLYSETMKRKDYTDLTDVM